MHGHMLAKRSHLKIYGHKKATSEGGCWKWNRAIVGRAVEHSCYQ